MPERGGCWGGRVRGKRERDANWEHVQKKICVNGAGRQDYEGGEETFDELGLSMRERRDKNSIADKRITY